MNKTRLLQAAEIFAKLGKKNSRPKFRNMGICSNFEEEFGINLGVLPRYVETLSAWTHYSGSVIYPVPSTIKNKSENYAYTSCPLWVGKYGEKRRLLARYLAREYRKMAKALDN